MTTHKPTPSNSTSPLPAGNERDFLARLSQRYRPILARYFERQIRDSGEIEDLVQEVFIRLAHRQNIASIDRLEGYLFETAANVIRDRVRRRVVRHADRHDSYEESLHAVEDFSPERVYLGEEALQEIVHALQELPERTRTVFILHRLEELRHADIARRLGISVSAVEKHVVKAMTYLSNRLGYS
jgi:RNA polymerase sigma factor (sigma-70 family)